MGFRKKENGNLYAITRVAMIMALDVLATSASFFFGLWFRADFVFANIRVDHMQGYLSAIGPWCVITVAVFLIFQLYNCIWAFVSTPEVFRITGAYCVLAVIGVLVFHFDGVLMPRASMVVGFLLSYVQQSNDSFSQRIIHHTIELIAINVMPAFVIRYLI